MYVTASAESTAYVPTQYPEPGVSPFERNVKDPDAPVQSLPVASTAWPGVSPGVVRNVKAENAMIVTASKASATNIPPAHGLGATHRALNASETAFESAEAGFVAITPVSYTHLTLPTILLV